MTVPRTHLPGQLERELAYYHRECNDLGSRLLRLQEEQSAAFREARRSRMVAKLIREAYRLADAGSSPDALGTSMLGIIVENVMCDSAAFLAEEGIGSGRFTITHAVGVPRGPDAEMTIVLQQSPACFFTTSRSTLEPPAYELTSLLRLPYILWSYDRASGHALILGNRSESNVNRPFEAGDQELIEGALSVYLDVRARKQAEVELRQAKANLEAANSLKAGSLRALRDRLTVPLEAILRGVGPLCEMDAGALDVAERSVCVSQIQDAREQLNDLFNELLNRPDGTGRPGELAPWETTARVGADHGVARTRAFTATLDRLERPEHAR